MLNKNGIYISLPMGGFEESIWKRYQEGVKYIKNKSISENKDIISPIDIEEFKDKKNFNKKRKYTYGYYLSRDLELLIDKCFAIVMCTGWEKSLGCRIELSIAKELNLQIIYMD